MKRISILLAAALVAAACHQEAKAPAADGKGDTTPRTTATTATATTSAATATAAAGTDVGATMPAYSTAFLDGSKFDVGEQKGKVVMLNVWATWCGPCRYEIPELQKLHEQYAAQGFSVVGVSVDEGNGDDVKQFVAENKITYPVAHDADGKLATLLDTSVLPTTVLLDRNGKIVWKKFGAIMPGDESATKAIEAALKG